MAEFRKNILGINVDEDFVDDFMFQLADSLGEDSSEYKAIDQFLYPRARGSTEPAGSLTQVVSLGNFARLITSGGSSVSGLSMRGRGQLNDLLASQGFQQTITQTKNIEQIVGKRIKNIDPRGQIAQRYAKRIVRSGKGIRTGLKNYLDELYSEALKGSGLSQSQKTSVLVALGRGPLAKARSGARLVGLDKALAKVISSSAARGPAGRRDAALILSMFLSEEGSGLRYGQDGKISNIRKVFSSLDPRSAKVIEELGKELGIIARAAEEIRRDPKNRSLSSAQVIAKAIEKYRAGGIAYKAGKEIKKTTAKPTYGMGSKSPIKLPGNAELEKKFAKIDAAAGSFVEEYIRGRSLASELAMSPEFRRLRAEYGTKTKERLAKIDPTRTKVARTAAFNQKRDLAEQLFKKKYAAFGHRDIRHFIEDQGAAIDLSKKSIRAIMGSRDLPDDAKTIQILREKALIEAAVVRLSDAAGILASFTPAERRRLVKESSVFKGADTNLKSILGEIKTAERVYLGETKLRAKNIVDVDKVSAEAERNFRKYAKDFLNRFSKPIRDLAGGASLESTVYQMKSPGKKVVKRLDEKGRIISTKAQRGAQEIQTMTLADLGLAVEAFARTRTGASIAAGGFGRGSKQGVAKLIANSPEFSEARKLLEDGARQSVKKLDTAIRNAEKSPTKENVDAVASIINEMRRQLPVVHSVYRKIGGEDGVILKGSGKRADQYLRGSISRIIKGTWFSNSPMFMEDIGFRLINRTDVRETRKSVSVKPGFEKQASEIGKELRALESRSAILKKKYGDDYIPADVRAARSALAAHEKIGVKNKWSEFGSHDSVWLEKLQKLRADLRKTESRYETKEKQVQTLGADNSIKLSSKTVFLAKEYTETQRKISQLNSKLGEIMQSTYQEIGGNVKLNRRQKLAALLHDPTGAAARLGIHAGGVSSMSAQLLGATVGGVSVASSALSNYIGQMVQELRGISGGKTGSTMFSGVTADMLKGIDFNAITDQAVKALSQQLRLGKGGEILPVKPESWNTKRGDTAWEAMGSLIKAAESLGLGKFTSKGVTGANAPSDAMNALLRAAQTSVTGSGSDAIPEDRAGAAKRLTSRQRQRLLKATDKVVDAAATAVAEDGPAVVRQSRRSRATVAPVMAAAPVAAAGGGSGGGGGGGGRRRTAVGPAGEGDGRIPRATGPAIGAGMRIASEVTGLLSALSGIKPVSKGQLSQVTASINAIKEMLASINEMRIATGAKSIKGMAAAMQSIGNVPPATAAAVARGGKGVAGGGDGGGTRRLIGYALPGSQDLREQEQNIGKFAQKTEGILGRFIDQIKFGFSQQIVGQISQGVGALLAHLQGGIIGFNAQLENSTVAFQTLFENEQTAMGAVSIDVKRATDQAQTMVSSIQNFANITPFRFPELVESARRMRAFGFETEEILPNLQSIGDAVAALGGEDDKLNRITYALGQMKQSGRVYQNDMMQLANAGIAGYDLLARAVIKNLVKTGDASLTYLGKKIEAVTDESKTGMVNLKVDGKIDDKEGARILTVAANRISKLGLGKSGVKLEASSKAAADAVEAINLIASQGPVQAMRTLAKRGKILGQDAARAIIAEMAAQFRGGMDKLSKTFKGALSTLQDTSQYMVALITKPIYDGVRDAMYQAGQFFQSKAARNMAQDFADTFASMLPTIGGILSDTASILGSFVKGVQELGGRILSFGSGVGQASSIIDMFRDGISAIATIMQNQMVRAAVVAAAAIKVFSMAFSANPMLLAITAIITGLGMLSKVYEENTFGMQDTINKYVAPMQGIVSNIQQNIIPVLMRIGEGFASIFQGGVLIGINAVLPALTIFLKLLNALLEIINRITPAANLLGAALSIIVAKKVFGGALFGQKAAFDASGNMVRAASGGLIGGIQRGVGGVVSSMGGTIARQDIYQQGFKATQAARSNTGLIRAQTSAARSVLQGAVARGAMSSSQMDDVLKVFGEKLQSIVAGSKNVKEARAALIRGGEFGRVVEAVMKTGRVAASTSDTAASIRLGNAARDIRTAANGFARSIGNFIGGVKMFVGVLPKLAQSLASVAKGGSFLPGSALLPLAGEWGKKGIGGTIQGRLRNVAGQGLGLTGRAVGKIGIAQGASGLLRQGVSSFGKLGGGLSLLGVGMDVASGVDPMRAGLRGGLGFGGSAIGAAAGSIFGPVGTILGGMAGGFLGSSIGDLLSDIMGISKETTQINQDLSEAEIKQRAWNAATADGVITYQELSGITDGAMVTVQELADQILLVNGMTIGGEGGPAISAPSISPELTFRNITAGLGLAEDAIKRNLEAISILQGGAEEYYKNIEIAKMNPLERGRQVDPTTGEIKSETLRAKVIALAQAEMILMLSTQGVVTSQEQLNQVLQTIAGKFDLTGDALKKYNLLSSAATVNTEKLSNALEKAQEKLSALQRKFGLASSALENRISMVFEKEMTKALEKAKDAFLETQTVMVEGISWNLLALRKEIEEQEKKNRLLEIEKNLREATLNVEMARLATYDASVDPLEAAARLREAEEAKTQAVKNAALERKKIALDEAMASTPIKEGLEQIEEYFDAAKLKFQEGMANILRLLEEGKISGEEAMNRIRALYTTTFAELGILDKNLEIDAQNFGDGFLNSWDKTVAKFIKLADKLTALLKKIKSIQAALKNPPTPKNEEETTDTTPTGTPQNSPSTLGGRAYDNYLGHGYSTADAMEKQIDVQMKQVDAQMKSLVRLKYNKLFGAFSKIIVDVNSGAQKIPFLYRSQWDEAVSKATNLFAPKGALNSVFVDSGKASMSWTTLLPRLNQGIISLKSLFKNQPVNPFAKFSTGLSSAGFASGGTIMGPGIFRVGEAGTETMQVTPFGVARVFPRTYRPINGISAVGGSTSGAVNASVIINNPTVRSDQDIRKLAEEVSRAQRSLLRSSGVGRI